MREKFFVLSIGRSRSYWLSRFLNTPTCRVNHEGSQQYTSIAEMLEKMPDGMVDSMLSLKWDVLPGKIVIITRPYDEVVASYAKHGVEEHPRLRRAWNNLKIAAIWNPVVEFKDLGKEEVCKWLFEYLTEEPFDRERWLKMDKMILDEGLTNLKNKVQTNLPNVLAMYEGVL